MNSHKITVLSTLPRLITVFLVMLLHGAAYAGTATEIDANVNAALSDFRKNVKGAEEYLNSAKGLLVVPQVKKVGFIVGGQWGEGVLKIGGKTVSYYKMEAGSVGFQAGYQKANYLFVFLTQAALDEFRSGKGWAAGVDAGVTVVDESIGASADTLKGKASVLAFIYGKKGLMGGISLKGQKLKKFNPDR